MKFYDIDQALEKVFEISQTVICSTAQLAEKSDRAFRDMNPQEKHMQAWNVIEKVMGLPEHEQALIIGVYAGHADRAKCIQVIAKHLAEALGSSTVEAGDITRLYLNDRSISVRRFAQKHRLSTSTAQRRKMQAFARLDHWRISGLDALEIQIGPLLKNRSRPTSYIANEEKYLD
jgi:hypothetical protein